MLDLGLAAGVPHSLITRLIGPVRMNSRGDPILSDDRQVPDDFCIISPQEALQDRGSHRPS
jgi:hypothetical protein